MSSNDDEKVAAEPLPKKTDVKCHLGHELESEDLPPNDVNCSYCNIVISNDKVDHCRQCGAFACKECGLLDDKTKWNFEKATNLAKLLVSNNMPKFWKQWCLLLSQLLKKTNKIADLEVVCNEWKDRGRMKTLLMIAVEKQNPDVIQIMTANDVKFLYLTYYLHCFL